jgi:hypothetical protein
MQHPAYRENVAARPELDDATIEFATQVFDLARSGDASTLERLLEPAHAGQLSRPSRCSAGVAQVQG